MNKKHEEIFELLKSKYAERSNMQVEQIDNVTLDILEQRAIRICYGSRGLREKTKESCLSSDDRPSNVKT